MYQVQYSAKQNKIPQLLAIEQQPYDLKAILQQKLTTLQNIKPQMLYNFPPEEKKKNIMKVKKIQFNSTNKQNNYTLNNTINNERYQFTSLNSQMGIHTQLSTHESSTVKRYNSTPERVRFNFKNSQELQAIRDEQLRDRQTQQFFFCTKDQNQSSTPNAFNSSTQKLPPLQIQVEKMRLTEKDPKRSILMQEILSQQKIYSENPPHNNIFKHQGLSTSQEPSIDPNSIGRKHQARSTFKLDPNQVSKKQPQIKENSNKSSEVIPVPPLIRSRTPSADQNQHKTVQNKEYSKKSMTIQNFNSNTTVRKTNVASKKEAPSLKDLEKDTIEKTTDCTNSINTECIDTINLKLKEKKKAGPPKIKKSKKTNKQSVILSPGEEKIIQKHTSYRCFINKINFSNNICITSPKPMQIPNYTVYIGKGNNSSLLRSAFKIRWWWQELETFDPVSVNMVWTQLRQNNFLELLPPVNSEDLLNSYNESHSQNGDVESDSSDSDWDQKRSKSVRTKVAQTFKQQTLNSSLQSDSKIKTIQQFKPTNYGLLKKLFNVNDLQYIVQYMEQNNIKESAQVFSDCSENLLLSIKTIYTNCITTSKQFKIHNHMENNWNLSNKKALFYNMRAYYDALNDEYSKYLPLTFHIQEGISDREWENFLDYYQKKNEEIKELEERLKTTAPQSYFDRKLVTKKQGYKKNIWIVKPGEMTNRGTGITVCSDLNEIKQIVSSGEVHPNGKLKTYIVQEYVDNPFLYNKRKFDIRCYMLATSVNGIFKMYWYQEGYIRTSSKEYTNKNFNKMIHLTNDAVQCKGEEYGKFESGNKISFLDFQRYLDMNYSDQKFNFYQDIYPKIKQIALDCIKAVYGKIDPKRRTRSFELFGLDFMIDDTFKLWLIEVNTNPCLELSCPLLSRIIPPMIENVLRYLKKLNINNKQRIAVDPIFPPPFIDEWPNNKKQFSPDNILENNKFELMFDEQVDQKSMKQLLLKLHTQNQQIFDIEEMEEEQEDE